MERAGTHPFYRWQVDIISVSKYAIMLKLLTHTNMNKRYIPLHASRFSSCLCCAFSHPCGLDSRSRSLMTIIKMMRKGRWGKRSEKLLEFDTAKCIGHSVLLLSL